MRNKCAILLMVGSLVFCSGCPENTTAADPAADAAKKASMKAFNEAFSDANEIIDGRVVFTPDEAAAIDAESESQLEARSALAGVRYKAAVENFIRAEARFGFAASNSDAYGEVVVDQMHEEYDDAVERVETSFDEWQERREEAGQTTWKRPGALTDLL